MPVSRTHKAAWELVLQISESRHEEYVHLGLGRENIVASPFIPQRLVYVLTRSFGKNDECDDIGNYSLRTSSLGVQNLPSIFAFKLLSVEHHQSQVCHFTCHCGQTFVPYPHRPRAPCLLRTLAAATTRRPLTTSLAYRFNFDAAIRRKPLIQN